jgi:hypothetical protein
VHVRITRTTSDPARYDENLAVARRVGEVLKLLPGCRRYLGAADRATGAGVAITLWDSAEAAAAFSRDRLGDLLPRMQELGIRMEAPEIYEVVVEV